MPEFLFTLPATNPSFESTGLVLDAHSDRLLSSAQSRLVVVFCTFKIVEAHVHWSRGIRLFEYVARYLTCSRKLRHFGPYQALVEQVALLSTPHTHGSASFRYAVSCITTSCYFDI